MDLEESEISGAYRDLRLGQVTELQLATSSAQVLLLSPHDEHRLKIDRVERPLSSLRRCAIAPQTPFIHRNSRQWGRVLTACQPTFTPGKMCEYYVELADTVQVLSEADMYVAFSDQAPDPAQQIFDYEFHPPIWKHERDRLVASYAALQSATFGIEDLVGARILLLAHQAEVAARVLGDRVCRYLLADEVGLGKTIEACVILKGLRRRYPKLRTLIIVPDSLLRQWHNELNAKFWLNFSLLDNETRQSGVPNEIGAMVSHEALGAAQGPWDRLATELWDLLIVDEAHNLRHNPRLYERVLDLSRRTTRSLILSATPVERRAGEYLALLKLMYPAHYDKVDDEAFHRMLGLQRSIRNTIAYLAQALNPNDFDAAEFQQEMSPVVAALGHDPVLAQLSSAVSPDALDGGRAMAARLCNMSARTSE